MGLGLNFVFGGYMILSQNCLGMDIHFVVIDHDPTVEPTDVPEGSLIVKMAASEMDKPLYFYKVDDGNTTNVQRLIHRHDYNYVGTPNNLNDLTQGFSSGSRVYNGSNLFECVKNDAGAAVWLQIG